MSNSIRADGDRSPHVVQAAAQTAGLRGHRVNAHGISLAGAVHTADGSIAYARLKMRRGKWSVDTVDRWSAANTLKIARRLSSGAALGISAAWRNNKNTGGGRYETPLSGANNNITPHVDLSKHLPLLEILSGCITALTTDDSFLLTLPLAFRDDPPDTFLSVYCDNGLAAFGVVVDKKLEAVLTFPYAGAADAEAAAGRVRRYWSKSLRRDDFPRTAFVWGNNNEHTLLSIDDTNDIETLPLALPDELADSDVMKAAGAALYSVCGAACFKLPPRFRFRRRRPLLIILSKILFCLSLAATAAAALLNTHAGRTLSQSESIYHAKFNENETLNDLNKTAGELSAKILAIEKAHARSTRWSGLLLLLSEIKPNDLYIDKLGSDDVKGLPNSMRIALSGWAREETSVTEFISGLQGSNFISGVSLSSMERDAKDKNICRFKVLCVIRLSND